MTSTPRGANGCLDMSCITRRLFAALGREPHENSMVSELDGDSCDLPSATMRSHAATALFDLLRQEKHTFENVTADLKAKVWTQLDALGAADLGVDIKDAAKLAGRGGIGYEEVYSGPEMTLCVFVLRAGAHIPLHDHPHMHVFGRLLFGRMRVVSFNLDTVFNNNATRTTGDRDPPPGSRWAQLRADEILGPAPVTYALGPQDGNLHELFALEDCAFFDVVLPPYDAFAGRDCTYYTRADEVAFNSFSDVATSDCSRYLLVPFNPHDFSTEPLEYLGPPCTISGFNCSHRSMH